MWAVNASNAFGNSKLRDPILQWKTSIIVRILMLINNEDKILPIDVDSFRLN